MDNNQKGFFDGNPKMLFVFGLVCGIAITMIVGGGVPSFGSDKPTTNDQVVIDDNNDPAQGLSLAGVDDSDHVRGDLNKAKVVLIEYSDFECPYCGRHNPTMIDVYEEYGDDVAWVYRHFPLTSIHPEAIPAALASECAEEQGKFWEFSDALYENQTLLSNEYYTELATDLGLDIEQFTSCYESQKYLDKVESDQASGSAAGVTGTPATFVNGQLVSGAYPFETFKGMIDEILGQ